MSSPSSSISCSGYGRRFVMWRMSASMPFDLSRRQAARGVGGNDEHDDYDVPALGQVSVPPREEVGGGHASTPANHVRVCDDLRQLVPVSRQEIRMPILDVAFPFVSSTSPRSHGRRKRYVAS